MASEINIKKIKEIAENLVRKIAPEAQIGVLSPKDSTVAVEVRVDDAGALIGVNAETLLALQHILRAIIKKSAGAEDEILYVDLDVNNYKKKRRDFLKELAVSTANEVALAKREMALAPMNAYERRVIHMELSERVDIATESRGSGPERRVVVRPAR
jgi:spoIIIJ-associated protein